MIKIAIRFENDMVVVFDKRGEQIPQYQGQYESVKDNVLRDAVPNTIFAHGLTDSSELQKISRETW